MGALDGRGTAHDVVAKLKELGGYELDESLAPGNMGARGMGNIRNILCLYPQFVDTGEKNGRSAIFQYRPELAVGGKQPAPKPKPNAKSGKAGYDNVTMKKG